MDDSLRWVFSLTGIHNIPSTNSPTNTSAKLKPSSPHSSHELHISQNQSGDCHQCGVYLKLIEKLQAKVEQLSYENKQLRGHKMIPEPISQSSVIINSAKSTDEYMISSNFATVLSHLAARAKAIVSSQRCHIYILDPNRPKTMFFVSSSRLEAAPSDYSVPGLRVSGLAASCILSGKTFFEGSPASNPLFTTNIDQFENEPTIIAPLLLSSAYDILPTDIVDSSNPLHVQAIFILSGKVRKSTFEDTSRSVLEAFCQHSAVFMRSYYEESQLTAGVAKNKPKCRDVNLVLRSVESLLDADICNLFVVDEQKQELCLIKEMKQTAWSKLFLEEGGQDANIIRIPLTTGIAGATARSGQISNVADAYMDKRFNKEVDKKTGYRTKTVLAVPTKKGAKVVGVIQAINKKSGDKFNTSDEIISMLAGQFISNSIDGSAEVDKMQIIFDAANEMNSASQTNISQLVKTALQRARQLLSSDKCTLFIIDNDTDELYFQHTPDTPEIRIPKSSGIAGFVATTGEALNIRNAYEDIRFNREVDEKTGYKTRAIICVPLITEEGEIVGVLQAVNKISSDPDPVFSSEDLRLLRVFARQAATAIQSYKAMQMMRDVYVACQAVSSKLELRPMIITMMEHAKILLHSDICNVFLVDHEKQEMKSIVPHGEMREIRIPMTQGLAAYSASHAEILNVHDAYMDERFNKSVDEKTRYRTKTVLCVPIKNKDGAVLGVVQAVNKKGNRPFLNSDAKTLEVFSAQCAVAIENNTLYESSKNMKEFLDQLVSSLPSLVMTFDQEGHLSSISNEDMATDLFALTKDDLKTNYRTWEVQYELCPLLLEAVGKVHFDIIESSCDRDVPVTHQDRHINFEVKRFDFKSSNDDTLQRHILVVVEDITPQKRLAETLGRYLTPAVAQKVINEDETGFLCGVRQQMTYLFSDLRGFTSFSEKMDAQDVVYLLNSYFTHQVDSILNSDGIIDKFIGDAIMAVFGSPYPKDRDATNSCIAALAMVHNLDVFNEHRSSAGLEPDHLGIGIGINTGEV
eukprot:TRINITY_DN1581_c0_g1_i16.p1 TRINITY_DN1581_c0_g1~~TRINITY_DN1581_c0_g1_i16.p1  ORF type:complete len:1031 (+),score=197.59 TRINITY_DN1581_c0_g1_i16:57-3149(+)